MSDEKLLTEKVVEVISELGLQDDSGTPPTISSRDVPTFMKGIDDLPLIMVSCQPKDTQSSSLPSAQRGFRTFPVQITLIGSSNFSQTKGRGKIQEWRNTIWNAFQTQQPLVLGTLPTPKVPNLYSQYPKEGVPIDALGWRSGYNALVIFVMITLQYTL